MALAFCLLFSYMIAAVTSAPKNDGKAHENRHIRDYQLGIYWIPECANPVSSIYWGSLNPISTKTVTLYIRNEGRKVIRLFKTTQNWNPLSASHYLTLDWNYEDQTTHINQVLAVTLTLAVSSKASAITNFNFDMIIIEIPLKPGNH